MALRAQTNAERELEQAIEITIETSRAAEDATHAQMEAEQRAELAIVEAERAKQAQHAAEKTAETALIEAEDYAKKAEAIRPQAHGGITAPGINRCSLERAKRHFQAHRLRFDTGRMRSRFTTSLLTWKRITSQSLFSSADTPFIVTDTSQCGNGTLNATVLVKAGRRQAVVDQIHGRTIRGRVLRATGAYWKSSPGLIFFQFTACNPTGTYTAATAEFDSWSSAKKAHAQLEQLGLEQKSPPLRYDLRPNQPTQHILRIPLDQHYLFEDDDPAKNRRMSITEEPEGTIVRTDYLGFDWFDGWLWSFDLTAKELMEQMLSRKDTATAIREAVARSKLAKYRTRISRQLVRSLQDSDILTRFMQNLGVSLDVMYSHYVLKHRGGNASDMIDKLAAETHSDEAEEQASCPICLAEVVEPIGLGCGHEYCAACLRGYLITAPERNRFPSHLHWK
ncbi:hypothetical protein F5887DRAFT_920106 [Amanita rubescens]|nr:hypothetical protein F5887DRAFT_920106 [Amanita rubescens]